MDNEYSNEIKSYNPRSRLIPTVQHRLLACITVSQLKHKGPAKHVFANRAAQIHMYTQTFAEITVVQQAHRKHDANRHD